MKQKCLIYPYSERAYGMVKYLNSWSCQYEPTAVVAPPSSGLNGKDAGFICNEAQMNITVSERFTDALKRCEVVIIWEHNYSDRLEGPIIECMKEALRDSKEVQCYIPLKSNDGQIMKDLAAVHKTEFHYHPNRYSDAADKISLKEDGAKCGSAITQVGMNSSGINACMKAGINSTNNCPIIAITGLFTGLNTERFLYDFVSTLKKEGIKAIGITTGKYDSFLDIYAIPAEIELSPERFHNKTEAIKDFVSEIIQCAQPEYIILNISDGVMRYNESIHNNNGFMPYLFSQALAIDGALLITDHMQYNHHFMEEMRRFFEYHLNTDLMGCIIANELVDIIATANQGTLQKCYLERGNNYQLIGENEAITIDQPSKFYFEMIK
ncbi:MAG: hypothetical protein LBV33_00745 [Lachnospiraceae bacterium]|jgi:peptide maturation system protein (TIGR04066 family)|nr:hypothetical protein [Lachnospiraceae bacterium]